MTTKPDVSFKAFIKSIINWLSRNPVETYGIGLFAVSIFLIYTQDIIGVIIIPLGFLMWFYMMWKEEQLDNFKAKQS